MDRLSTAVQNDSDRETPENASSAAAGAHIARKLPWHRKLAYSALCVLIVLFLAEGGLRVRAWLRYGTTSRTAQNAAYVFDENMKLLVPRPGAELHGSQINVTINSLGFRGDEFTREKPANTLRIACLGASTTYCPEVSNNAAAWPAQLQSLLQARYPNVQVEVINAGIQGLSIEASLKNLRYRVLPLDPNLVIYYEAHNDLVADTRQLAMARGLIDDGAGRQSALSQYLSQKSMLYYLVYRNVAILSGKEGSANGRLNDLPPDLPKKFVAHLQEMHGLLAAKGIPLVLSRFLLRFRRSQPRDEQLENATIAFTYMPWMSLDSMLDGFDLYNDATEQFARTHSIPYVNDDESVPGDAVHYVDHVHFSDAGCRAMAERFAQFLTENGILDSAAGRLSRRPAAVAAAAN